MIKKLSVYLAGYRNKAVGCLFLVLGEVLCELAIPLLMSRIVDVGVVNEDLGYMAGVGGIMLGVAVFALFFGVMNARFSADVSQGFGAAIRRELYARTENFSFSNIDKFSGASLVTRMTSDVTWLQVTMMMVFRMLLRAPIMLVSALIVAASINLELSSVIIAAVILLAVGTVLIVRTVGALYTALQKKLDNLNGTVQENLIAIRVVKAFVREGYERTKFKTVNDEYRDAAVKAGSVTALIMPIMMFVLNGTVIGVVWFGGRFVGGGIMTTGELMSFLSYIMQILMSVMLFSMVFVMLTRAKASAERVLEVIETEPDVKDAKDAAVKSYAVKEGRVEFQNVSFRYEILDIDRHDVEVADADNVLEGVSFTANPGEFVGIIGGTGSGKTSLVSLIPRFYDVTAGAVLVDGKDVREYGQEALREGIGMVMQKNNLFTGTIRENLLWGKADATEDEITAAAKSAEAHDFITAFPDGYDTLLSQGGVNVSGGQKQRLCIARAMMRKPPVLILDDSTSAVDTATEAGIRASLRAMKGTTVLIVAQRISSVKDADKIIVLDGGRISAIGTHDELYDASEIYREICTSQNVSREGGVA